MPKWLIAALSWGGAALAVLSIAALILVQVMTPTSTARGPLFVILFVGVVAAGIGFLLGRRKT